MPSDDSNSLAGLNLTPAEKRTARFRKAQAGLSPDQLAKQNEANRTPSKAPVAQTTAYELEMAKRWFLEFLQDIHPTLDANALFLTKGAEAPDVTLLKEYGRYLVRSRVGRISDKLSVNSVLHYMRMALSVIQQSCGHSAVTMAPIRSEVNNFVRGDLVEQEKIATTMHVKGVAHSEDVTFLLSKLYSPGYLATFPNMRTVLNLTLYMLLIIDLCGRGAEIARNALRPEHMCLRWEDVTFYTFQRDDDDSVDIRAQIKVRWSKGTSLSDWDYKTVPLPGLLPTSMALQDTLRMLLTVALMDGALDGVQNWSQLFGMRLPADIAKTGRKIRHNPDMLHVPVLRRMTKREVTNTPVMTGDMQREIKRLGLYCGLEQRLTAYCLRRGVAYVLAHKTTDENRKFLMGHHLDSITYAVYMSKISTIDFPALFRDIDQRPVTVQSGLSLNCSAAVPTSLSEEGKREVMEDEDVQAALHAMETIRTSIKLKHKSLAAAARSSDQLWEMFSKASGAYRSSIRSAQKRVFAREYKQHFQQLSFSTSSTTHQARNNSALDVVESDQRDADLPLFVGQDEEISFDDRANEEDASDNAVLMIDPRLGDSLHDPVPMLGEGFVDELLALEDTNDGVRLDDVQTQDSILHVVGDTEDTLDMAQHGRPDDVRGTLRNRVNKKSHSAYNDMVGAMEDTKTEEELAACMETWYSVCHAIDDFPPGEEPIPGTFDCRFCGKDLGLFHHTYEHTSACARNDASLRAKALLEALCPLDRPCKYQSCGARENFGKFVTCGQTFKTLKQRGEHMREHVRAMNKWNSTGTKVPTCFFDECALSPEKGRLNRNGPDFESEEERMEHLWKDHGVSTLKTVNITYCEYCSTWLLEPHEWLWHAKDHLDDAQNIIAEVGYCGAQAGRSVMPRICPFCFHDESLPTHQRITTYTREGHLTHIGGHMRTIQEEMQSCPCYPSTCSKAGKMDGVALATHLAIVHNCSLPDRIAKRNEKASPSTLGAKKSAGNETSITTDIEEPPRKKAKVKSG